MKRPRVILADDHPLMMEALKNLLEPDFEIVGTFTNGQDLVDAALELKPNVVVLDIGMPHMNGLNAGQRLKAMIPTVKLVYLTMNQDQDTVGEAFSLGASAYVVKSAAASELVRAMNEVIRGGFYVTPWLTTGIVGSVIQSFKKRKKNRLTLRQKEVLQLLAEGHSMKGAAFILKVSPRTVAYHKYTMMDHLSIKSTAELIEYAIKCSLVVV
jgi:DNA-binding NarL/FixJ family response regulator